MAEDTKKVPKPQPGAPGSLEQANDALSATLIENQRLRQLLADWKLSHGCLCKTEEYIDREEA